MESKWWFGTKNFPSRAQLNLEEREEEIETDRNFHGHRRGIEKRSCAVLCIIQDWFLMLIIFHLILYYVH